MSGNLIPSAAVAEHASRDSCWIIVHGKVYDVTEFLDGTSNMNISDDASADYEQSIPEAARLS